MRIGKVFVGAHSVKCSSSAVTFAATAFFAGILFLVGCAEDKIPKAVPASGHGESVQDTKVVPVNSAPYREDELLEKVREFATSLSLPKTVVLKPRPFADSEAITHFVTAVCRQQLQRMEQAPKSPTNLFDRTELMTLCESDGSTLKVVPGKYIFKHLFTQEFSETKDETTEVTLAEDASVTGYRTVGTGKRSYEISAKIESNRVIRKSAHEDGMTLTILSLDGSYEYSYYEGSATRFTGKSYIKTLKSKKFDGLKSLEVTETLIPAQSGIFSSGRAAQTACRVVVKDESSKVIQSVLFKKQCFEGKLFPL